MQTIQDWLRQHNQLTNRFDQPISQADLRRLLGHLLGTDNAWLYANQGQPLTADQNQQLEQWLDQLTDGYPLAYITGQQLFWDLDLLVNSSTLIPRPDSETLIETAVDLLANNHPAAILDLGTGSGALALALAHTFPQAMVTAIDKSAAALEIAIQNASRNQINNVEFLESDWFAALGSKKFDLIISNPPYIAADDAHLTALKHEPSSALMADQNGLGDFIRIANNAKQHLTQSGVLMVEHGWQQKHAVQEIFHAAGFKNINSVKDLAGNDRVTYGHC